MLKRLECCLHESEVPVGAGMAVDFFFARYHTVRVPIDPFNAEQPNGNRSSSWSPVVNAGSNYLNEGSALARVI